MQEQGYRIIRNEKQYYKYCDILEKLVAKAPKDNEDDIELLTLLIEKYDEEHMPSKDINPIELIEIFMKEHEMKANDLAALLNVNKSTVSRILNYQKGLSKRSIRIIANHFAISQEALNKPYKLKNKINHKFRNASLMNTKKRLESKEDRI